MLINTYIGKFEVLIVPDLARTVFLPEDWKVPSDDNKANGKAEAGADDTAAVAEETVTLPLGTLVEIAAIDDTSQICQIEQIGL